jgi:hypothetical protein
MGVVAMRSSVLRAAWPGVLLAAAACAGPVVETPAVPTPAPVTSNAPEETPVIAPTPTPAATVVAAGAAPPVDCGGGVVSSAVIDYAANAPGEADILAATRGFAGVLPTDTIVVEPTATVVIRGGRPIWRGDWFDGGRGFLLGSTTACPGAGIRPSP